MSDGFPPDAAPAAFALAARLTRYAARRAPPSLAERLEEEWLADLAAQPSAAAGLSFALGCCWATVVIAREHHAAGAAASTRGKTITLAGLRSYSMTRFKWLWIAIATLGATALLVFLLTLVAGLTGHLLPFLSRHSAYLAGSDRLFGFWMSLAVGGGSIVWMIVISLHQMRVHRHRDEAPSSAGRPTVRPPFWLLALVISATSAVLFAASARLGFATVHIADIEARMAVSGGAVMFSAIGTGLLVHLACAHHIRRRGRPSLSGLR